MQDFYESDTSAFVGISFSTHVVYNIVEREGEFEYTGLSIIQYLKRDKNKFIAKIIESQSYESIEVILDDEIVFGDHFDNSNTNMHSFADVYNIMGGKNNVNYFYIYDMSQDVLIVKTPQLNEPIAIDYNISSDVRNFLNRL